MKLEKGMYARVQELNDVIIVKILKVEDDGFNADNNMFYIFSEVIKASYNLKDVIEVGDIVNGKYVVSSVGKGYINFAEEVEMMEYEIPEVESVLTKEQFENNCYRMKNIRED